MGNTQRARAPGGEGGGGRNTSATIGGRDVSSENAPYLHVPRESRLPAVRSLRHGRDSSSHRGLWQTGEQNESTWLQLGRIRHASCDRMRYDVGCRHTWASPTASANRHSQRSCSIGCCSQSDSRSSVRYGAGSCSPAAASCTCSPRSPNALFTDRQMHHESSLSCLWRIHACGCSSHLLV